MGGAFPPLRDRLRVDAKALGEGSQARLTMLYRSTDRRRRCGAPMVNLAHRASRPSCEKSAPSNPGINHPRYRCLLAVAFEPALLCSALAHQNPKRYSRCLTKGGTPCEPDWLLQSPLALSLL